MILWSIQTVEFYERLNRHGINSGDYRRISNSDKTFYKWMSTQMYFRGISSHANRAPIWAWYIYENNLKCRPDLRHSWLLPPKTRGVRIKLNVPEKYILLSQFEMWTYVLGNNYVPENYEEQEYVRKLEETCSLSQDQIKKSWDRIFDLKFGDPNFWKEYENRGVQACLPFMLKKWVKKLDFFIAR